MKFVLNNLHEGDLFNIIAFDSEVESWRPELQRFNDETRKEALGFVEGIYAGGSTNIDGALRTALRPIERLEPAQYRAVHDRRPADRRRAKRSQDRGQLARNTTKFTPGFSRSASASI